MSRGTIYKKDVFQLIYFLLPKLPIFAKKSHFLLLNGRNVCHNLAQSCPRGWKRLTRKIFNCGTKLTNVVLKVWDNKWDCGGYTTPSRILRRLYQEKIIKNHQNCKYTKISPAMPTNQLTCTTNMILSHYMHRLWGLQRSKVLKSILHCNWEIFISPGNSSELLLLKCKNKEETNWFPFSRSIPFDSSLLLPQKVKQN